MKKDFTKDFDEITKMCNIIRSPRKLNEAISFSDEYDDEEMPVQDADPRMNGANGNGNMPPTDTDMSDEEMAANTPEGSQAINQIREIALKGMVRLCHSPEDPVYETLKKIFQFCDKAVTEKANEQK